MLSLSPAAARHRHAGGGECQSLRLLHSVQPLFPLSPPFLLQQDIGKRVEEKINRDQRRYFLMEQVGAANWVGGGSQLGWWVLMRKQLFFWPPTSATSAAACRWSRLAPGHAWVICLGCVAAGVAAWRKGSVRRRSHFSGSNTNRSALPLTVGPQLKSIKKELGLEKDEKTALVQK